MSKMSSDDDVSESPVSDADDAIIAAVSDYLDDTLPQAQRADVETKIKDDADWKRVHDEMVETRNFLSGMQKARAPATFAQDVTHTIHTRSAGKFFARRTFGDRVPFGVILAIALVVLVAIGVVMWSSSTGSLRVQRSSSGSAQGSGIVDPQ